VGYGFLSPNTIVMKIVTIFYIYVGIAFVAGMVGTVLGRTVGKFATPKVPYTEAAGNIRRYKRFLTYNQLELLRSVFIIVSLSTLGTVFFAINEQMTIMNAFYYTMTTLSTVGYGDVHIKKTSSKIFNIFFVIVGATLNGMAVFKLVDVLTRIEQQKSIIK